MMNAVCNQCGIGNRNNPGIARDHPLCARKQALIHLTTIHYPPENISLTTLKQSSNNQRQCQIRPERITDSHGNNIRSAREQSPPPRPGQQTLTHTGTMIVILIDPSRNQAKISQSTRSHGIIFNKYILSLVHDTCDRERKYSCTYFCTCLIIAYLI